MRESNVAVPPNIKTASLCYHCGAPNLSSNICLDDKVFCCEGCKTVFEILDDNGLCNYYALKDHPGLRNIRVASSEKFSFLDDEKIASRLSQFTDGDSTIVTLYIPGVHCSSCMWLLEHLQKLNDGITDSRLNYGSKELTIHFSASKISLRQVADLLTTIGYEPYISLDDDEEKKKPVVDRMRLYKLGVAGFCFANIMMMSFPEYLGGAGFTAQYANFFRWLNLTIALPVFLFSASEFFSTAWKGLKARTLNIDAPIALAIIITFSRSLYEIISGSGAGYLDSMSGIVFFMLVGRVVQERTYRSISFHRDYKSYFPIAVRVENEHGLQSKSLHDLCKGDVVHLSNNEIIPADGMLIKGKAHIDYSFVTGESEPVSISSGTKVYAGGRQMGESIVVEILKPVAGSYLTTLWNHQVFFGNKDSAIAKESMANILSRYFTLILFSLALVTGIFWAINDPSKILNSVTSMLIVACPCALLLSSTFTNGNLLRIFSRGGLYLRDASVIESLSDIDHVVFDKTGTLTQGTDVKLYDDNKPSRYELDLIHNVTQSSNHPYSRALNKFSEGGKQYKVEDWKEISGRGVEAIVDGVLVKIGNAPFAGGYFNEANVHARIDNKLYSFVVVPKFRVHLQQLVHRLEKRFELSLISGDNDHQRSSLQILFGKGKKLLFGQKPIDKLLYIERLQMHGGHVLMIGDGLNDAGALKQSDVGITLTDDINNFSPACDAILDARYFDKLPSFLALARAGRWIIIASFVISVCYNIVGLFFAVQGRMNPMIAAILMPISTLSIVLISTGASYLAGRLLGLKNSEEDL